MTDTLKVLHCTLEYKKGVGGIKSVTTGLIPALAASADIEVAIVTPFFDVYEGFYTDLEEVGTVKHIYMQEVFCSKIFRACTDLVNGQPVYHYLIHPGKDSGLAKLFCIEDESNVYKAFEHSDPNRRLEYFNGALASMLRTQNIKIPTFDIVHTHTWHAGIVNCLSKEFENLNDYKDLLSSDSTQLRKIPYVVSTVHMLLDILGGWMRNPSQVKRFTDTLGLPDDILRRFPEYKSHISESALMRHMFSLVYADAVVTVSRGLKEETLNGKAQGLEKLFKQLDDQKRLYGITNGIDFKKYDGSNVANLGEFAIDKYRITASKLAIKRKLAAIYPKLDPNKQWFVYIGRFALEKGVDMLPTAIDAISAANANFIIMGFHVAFNAHNGELVPVYKSQIDYLANHDHAVLIDNASDQYTYGNLFRAAADSMLVLSHNEACGLVPMEGMANGAICVAPSNQGLTDTVKPLEGEFATGTGFLYSDDPLTRNTNLALAISQAAEYLLNIKQFGALDTLLARIMHNAKDFDWSARPVDEYRRMYSAVTRKPLLTFDMVRDTSPMSPILYQYNQAENATRKIFQIGFNKCGTSSLFDFFWSNGVRGVHYGFGYVADSMYDNLAVGNPLIADKYIKYPAYFDIENIYASQPRYMHRLYKELDAQYPGSKFILNTRDKQKWLRSRSQHYDCNAGRYYIDVVQQRLGLSSVEDVLELWSKEWDEHHAAVQNYFKDRPNDLLVYDIEIEPIQKLCTFFKDMYYLDPKKMKHVNKTTSAKKLTA